MQKGTLAGNVTDHLSGARYLNDSVDGLGARLKHSGTLNVVHSTVVSIYFVAELTNS